LSNSSVDMVGTPKANPALRPGLIRRLYDWVLHWAETPYGPIALFILAFAESSFFPIPPDVLLIALAISIPTRAFRYAAICSVGSTLGGIFGYGIGWQLWDIPSVEHFFFTYIPGFTKEVFDRVAKLYNDWNFWVVFIAAFTPIPYKVITITAGVFDINFPMFIIATIVGRSARFFLVGGLIWRFGAPIKGFIDKYFNLLSIAFVVLLVLGFAIIKFFVK